MRNVQVFTQLVAINEPPLAYISHFGSIAVNRTCNSNSSDSWIVLDSFEKSLYRKLKGIIVFGLQLILFNKSRGISFKVNTDEL